MRPAFADLREDVGVEQSGGHRSTSRTGIRFRDASMPADRCGEICIASTKAFPLRSPARRRKSSAPTTTTSSRPWTVTCCGPSSFARRTTSLNLALASCNCHWPGRARRDFDRRPAGGEVLSGLVMLTRSAQAPRRLDWTGLKAAPGGLITGVHSPQHIRPACVVMHPVEYRLALDGQQPGSISDIASSRRSIAMGRGLRRDHRPKRHLRVRGLRWGRASVSYRRRARFARDRAWRRGRPTLPPAEPPAALQGTARVTIESTPANADVTVGEFIGTTPLVGYPLAAGTRRITLSKRGLVCARARAGYRVVEVVDAVEPTSQAFGITNVPLVCSSRNRLRRDVARGSVRRSFIHSSEIRRRLSQVVDHDDELMVWSL
jgi:PEGA domain